MNENDEKLAKWIASSPKNLLNAMTLSDLQIKLGITKALVVMANIAFEFCDVFSGGMNEKLTNKWQNRFARLQLSHQKNYHKIPSGAGLMHLSPRMVIENKIERSKVEQLCNEHLELDAYRAMEELESVLKRDEGILKSLEEKKNRLRKRRKNKKNKKKNIVLSNETELTSQGLVSSSTSFFRGQEKWINDGNDDDDYNSNGKNDLDLDEGNEDKHENTISREASVIIDRDISEEEQCNLSRQNTFNLDWKRVIYRSDNGKVAPDGKYPRCLRGNFDRNDDNSTINCNISKNRENPSTVTNTYAEMIQQVQLKAFISETKAVAVIERSEKLEIVLRDVLKDESVIRFMNSELRDRIINLVRIDCTKCST